MNAKYRLAVIDDHPLVRQGIAENLEDEADFAVVAQGGSADDAVRIAHDRKPHLIFLDLNMPGGGLEAATRIKAEVPGVMTVMFSFRQDLTMVRACLAAGARGYIVKGISGPDLNEVAHRLLNGETYIDPELASRLALEEAS